MIDTRSTGYAFNFEEPPAIGTQVTYWGDNVATLIRQCPYTRKTDGRESWLLTWSFEDGRIGKSGLRSKSITWISEVEEAG